MAGLFNPFSKRKQRGDGAAAASPGAGKRRSRAQTKATTTPSAGRVQEVEDPVELVEEEEVGGRAASNHMAGRSKKDLLTSCETLQKHALILGLLERKCMKLSEANNLCEEITGDKANLFALLGSMNKELQVMQVKVKTAGVPSCPGEGEAGSSEVYVSLINIAKDEASKQSCKLNFAEMSYFKQMIETMLQKPDLCASMIDLLNLEQQQQLPTAASTPSASQQRIQQPQESNDVNSNHHTVVSSGHPSSSVTLTKKEKESLVLRLTKEVWLRQVSRKYTLGPRTFLELKPLLLQMDLPPELAKELN